MNIDVVMEQIFDINVRNGWYSKGEALFCEKMLLIISEISEAVEEFRSGRRLDEIYYTDTEPKKPEGIPIEIADAVIRIFDWCQANDVDLVHALNVKINYNKTRPFRHGNKRV